MPNLPITQLDELTTAEENFPLAIVDLSAPVDKRTKKIVRSNLFKVQDNLISTSSVNPLSANQGKELNIKKIDYTDIVDDLISTYTYFPLSANQGRILNETKEPVLNKGNLITVDPLIHVGGTNAVIGNGITLTIADASIIQKGAVQLSNRFDGISQTYAITELALSDGLFTKLNKMQQVIYVAKSGGDFTRLTDAQNSYTDNSYTKKYILATAPGFYDEDLNLKPHTFVVGLGTWYDVGIRKVSANFSSAEYQLSGLRNLYVNDIEVNFTNASYERGLLLDRIYLTNSFIASGENENPQSSLHLIKIVGSQFFANITLNNRLFVSSEGGSIIASSNFQLNNYCKFQHGGGELNGTFTFNNYAQAFISGGRVLSDPLDYVLVFNVNNNSLLNIDNNTFSTCKIIKGFGVKDSQIQVMNATSAGMISDAPSYVNNLDGSIYMNDGQGNLYDNDHNFGIARRFAIRGTTLTFTDNTNNYVVVNYNSGNPIYSTSTSKNYNNSDIIPVKTFFREGTILHPTDWGTLGEGLPDKLNQRIIETNPFARAIGLTLGESPTRIITVTSGVGWYSANRLTFDAFNSSTDVFYFIYHVAGVWTINKSTTLYNNTQWDNGTDLVNLLPNKWTVVWVYRGLEKEAHVYYILGNASYNSLADAEQAQEPSKPPIINEHAFLVGRILVQNGATSGTVESAFSTFFGSQVISSHLNLNDLNAGDGVGNHSNAFNLLGRSGGQIAYGGINASENLTLRTTSNATKGNYIFTDLVSGLVKSTSGTLSAITDNSANWDTAYSWGNHALAGYALNSNTYWTSQSESNLTNEVNLGALTTGLLKHTVLAGVSTPATAVAGVDYENPLYFTSGLTRGATNIVVNDLITGKSGGQTIYGGINTSENLTISSTSNITKGQVILDSDLNLQAKNILNVESITHDGVTTSDFIIKNLDQDKDVVINVNGGGLDTEAFRIKGSNKRFGFGTPSPNYNIHLLTVGENAAQVWERSGGASLFFSATASFGQLGTVSNHPLRFLLNSVTKGIFDTTGYFGIGGNFTPSYNLSLYGNVVNTIGMERHTTSNTAGNDLIIKAGCATSGSTDKNGGISYLNPGCSTGTGFTSVRLGRYTRSVSTGTADNTLKDAVIVTSQKRLTDNSAIPLFDVSLNAGEGAGGFITYSIFASDGTDHQIHSGYVGYSAVNKAGVYTTSISEITSGAGGETEAKSAGGSTLTDTWTITTGTNKITINLNANSSLTVTSLYIIYTIFNNSLSSITQL